MSDRSLVLPPELAAVLESNAAAKEAFERLPPSHRRTYVNWIMEAKKESTRRRRAQRAVAVLAIKKR